MKLLSSSLVLLALGYSLQAPELFAQQNKNGNNPAVIPASREVDASWTDRHKALNARAKQGDVDLLFIGDSITYAWEGAGKDVWSKFYSKRKAMNLGINGDGTEHVLWRLDHGNIDGIKPKLAVVMIGTNNVGSHSAEQIAEGIGEIVKKLRAKLPDTKILVLGILPRDEKSSAPIRAEIAKINELASKYADNRAIFYLDFGSKLINADGTISKDIMPDFCHLSPKGYEIWAESMEPDVVKLIRDDQ